MTGDWTDYQDSQPIPPAPGLGDREAMPAPESCLTCGLLRPWTWWEPRPEVARRWRGRWCPPSERCVGCEDQAAAWRRRDVLHERQRRAGIPPKLRGYSLDRMLKAGGDIEAFRARMKAGDTLGVLPENDQAWRDVRAHRTGSLLLVGPVGTGKSAAAAALASRALGEVRAPSVTPMADHLLQKRYGDAWELARTCGKGRTVDPGTTGLDVLWTDEADLLDRQQQASTLDRDPKRAVAEAGLLVYDDLGAECGNAGKRADYARDLVARLVRYRYDRRLPMIVTSNLDVDQLGTQPAERRPGAGLDARTVDRLAEMLTKVVRFGGVSWRQ